MKTAAILITCDRPQLVEEALASILRQSLPVDELIVVDDGAIPVSLPDATMLRSGPGAGPSAARNLAALAASADTLLFLDDDDLWAPDHVARLAELMQSNDLAASGMTHHRRRGGTAHRAPPPRLDVADWLTGNAGVQGSNLAVRRQALLSLGGFDEALGCCEDMDLMVRAADAGLRYASHGQATVDWRTHAGPRITDGRRSLRHPHRTFLAAHGGRMTAGQVASFRDRCSALFGADPGPLPRLTWLLGPPGAGKTTWATRHARGADRVMDFTEAMIWLDGADLGVRRAKRHLAEAIRVTEANRGEGERRLFVTPAYFSPEDLGPLASFEHLICVVPAEPRWERQLAGREGVVQPRDRAEHGRWVAAFGCGASAAAGGQA
jgi:hypothetical protein